ncbi:hypothetical protein BC936DRAFT_142914, partial [Jimgerdemannia flammicorona]
AVFQTYQLPPHNGVVIEYVCYPHEHHVPGPWASLEMVREEVMQQKVPICGKGVCDYDTSQAMPRCTHKGCEKEYEEEENLDNAQSRRIPPPSPSLPVSSAAAHFPRSERKEGERMVQDQRCPRTSSPTVVLIGLKGWQCCNKRVTSFDDFLAIPGCTFDKHSDTPVDVKAVEKKHEDIPQISSHVTKDGVEIYDNGATIKLASHTPPPQTVAEAVDTSQVEKSPAEPELPEEDDLSIPVAPGTTCKRRGCDAEYKDETTSRGEGTDAECKHHPGRWSRLVGRDWLVDGGV